MWETSEIYWQRKKNKKEEVIKGRSRSSIQGEKDPWGLIAHHLYCCSTIPMQHVAVWYCSPPGWIAEEWLVEILLVWILSRDLEPGRILEPLMDCKEYCNRKTANKTSKILFQVGKILNFIKIRIQLEHIRVWVLKMDVRDIRNILTKKEHQERRGSQGTRQILSSRREGPQKIESSSSLLLCNHTYAICSSVILLASRLNCWRLISWKSFGMNSFKRFGAWQNPGTPHGLDRNL